MGLKYLYLVLMVIFFLIFSCKEKKQVIFADSETTEIEKLYEKVDCDSSYKIYIFKKEGKYYKSATQISEPESDWLNQNFTAIYEKKLNNLIEIQTNDNGEDHYTVISCFLDNKKIKGGYLLESKFGSLVNCNEVENNSLSDKIFRMKTYWKQNEKKLKIIRSDLENPDKLKKYSCEPWTVDTVDISNFLKEIPQLIKNLKK